jgi:hypothetical protein
MRSIFKWVVIVLALAMGTIIGAYFLAKKYEEPVRNYIVGEVNKRLASPVHVGDINFTLLERFPSASLVMDSMWAEENIVKMGAPDTLLFFRKVYLNLNLFDILGGQYKINEIEARDGFVRLMVDKKGYDNYHIWKQGDGTTGFLLELNKVHIENGALCYQNIARQQNIELVANDLWFTGKFSEDNYTMAVRGDGQVQSFDLKKTNYLKDRKVAVECDFDITTSTETYSFKHGRLLIDDALDFSVAGKLYGGQIDLHVVGKNLDIIESITLIPSESRSMLGEYSSSGQLDFDCTLKGAFGNTDNPRLRLQFSVDGGSIRKKGSDWKLTDLVGKGVLDNGESRSSSTTSLELESLSGKFNEDAFAASFSIHNFLTPTVEGKLDLLTDIQALDEFFDLEYIELGKGKLAITAEIKTTLAEWDNPKSKDFLNASAAGDIRLSNATLRLKDDERNYTIDTASFTIQNNALLIRTYNGFVNDCSIELEGRANYFLDYFFTETGKMEIDGKVKVSDIDLQALFPNKSADNQSNGVVLAFPERANWNLEIIAKSFVNGKFLAEEISGVLKMNSFKVEASSLHFLGLGGNIVGRAGVYRFDKNQFGIKTDFDATDVDVKTLFSTFNEFDQKFITSENLSGRADANVQFQAFCDSAFGVKTETIIANADLKIRNGALTGFEPLISIADQIKKKPMLRLFISTEELRKRLENIQFAELSNEISIRQGVVTIPQMEIKSSAINLNISGTHTFDNKIDYAIDFALSELMELKDRKEPYNEYVQRDATGRTRIFITMKGTTSDFEVDVQKTNLSSSFKSQMISEKNTVKGLLIEEFNVFKNDSDARYSEPEKEDLKFDFDPEATKNQKDTSAEAGESPAKSPKDKNVLNRVIKKSETDKKKLKDGDFEDDDF